MIGDCLDVVVRVCIEMLARLPFVAASLNHVVKVGDDARGDDHLAARKVEIDAPGVVTGPVGEDLYKDVAKSRMVAPRCQRSILAMRSASDAPGLPTREWVKTPWQP